MAAGIFRMKPLYFLWMNFLSAVAWAPFHLVPGYSFGIAAADTREARSNFLMKCSTSSGTSSRRSRSGGTCRWLTRRR